MKVLLWRRKDNVDAKRNLFITYKSRKSRDHLTLDLTRASREPSDSPRGAAERENYSGDTARRKKTNINKGRGRQGKTPRSLRFAGGRGMTLNWQVETCLWMLGGRSIKPIAGLGYTEWNQKMPTLSKQEHSKLLSPHSVYFAHFPFIYLFLPLAVSSLASRARPLRGLLRYFWKILSFFHQ